MLERKSSIDSEPQTLSPDQIQYAREAALYVLRSKSFEEAINIFTEGLQPVSIAGRGTDDNEDDNDDYELNCLEEYHRNVHLLEEDTRDIATAPF